MLQDQNLDDVIDAFEAGYADAIDNRGAASPCPFGGRDKVRRAAWIDGVSFNTALAADPARNGESPSLSVYATDGDRIGGPPPSFVRIFRPTGVRQK